MLGLLSQLGHRVFQIQEEVFSVLGQGPGPGAPFSLEDLLAWGAMDKLEAVAALSTAASKEHSLRRTLAKM
ncbi:dynein heavy chain, partial [Haematococcus lacustris]